MPFLPSFVPSSRAVKCIYALLPLILITAAIALETFPFKSTAGAAPNPEAVIAAAPVAPPTGAGAVKFDFDGDGKADIGRWRSANTEFTVKNSNGGSYSTYTLGTSSAKAAPGDFDGDGKTDAAVFNAGTWTIRPSSTVSANPTPTPTTVSFGQSGDMPVAADYDGDGKTDFAIVRPSTTTWWVKESSTGSVVPYNSGNSNDIPVPGDYDADGRADIALYRPGTGVWTITYSSNNSTASFTWGQAGTDVPVPADYDGDGQTDLAIFRRSTGTWYVVKSSNQQWIVQAWGNYGDQPAPANYTGTSGDRTADLTVWRPSTGMWYSIDSQTLAFSVQPLGVAGDTAVPSAYLKQVGGTVSADQLAQSRLAPKNATGATDLYSKNFSWGTSLVSLPGRAGLNAGLGISYNSLVWTKSGSEIYFDADNANVSPGFRMGFPTIEPAYLDGKTGNYAYLMVTPSGGRVEFRQIVATNYYDTADSSYARLEVMNSSNPNAPVEALVLKVTTTDGTQMTYTWTGGAFRCSKVMDRNGNYITVAHNAYGQLEKITDTLGRVIKVFYDTEGYPLTVRQAWGSGTNGSGALTTGDANMHVWATFSYTTQAITTDFDGSLTVVGPPNTTAVKVLDKIAYPDGSSTRFTYNGYAQVYKVENWSAEVTPVELNHVRVNLDSPGNDRFDVPTFDETWNWAKDFNNDNEVHTITTSTAGETYTPPVGSNETATLITVTTVGHPNQLQSKVFVAQSGYREGLPIATEDWTEGASGWTKQRWTWTKYTQDNESLAYPLNPRVVETRVGDAGNTKRTTIDYLPISQNSPVAKYGLVSRVDTYDANLTTVIKRAETDYNLSSAYTDRRLIGLPSETRSYGVASSAGVFSGSLNLIARATYVYDGSSFGDANLNQNISPTQHDTNYGASLVTGRGNLTSATSWEAPNSTTSITTSVKYNTAGSVVARTSPWDGSGTRTVKIDYADAFDNYIPTTATYAYPTVLTDAAGATLGEEAHSSTVKYRFDLGANVEANSPKPTGQSYGKKSKRIYDGFGRLGRESIYVNATEKTYTRYEYPTNGRQSKAFSTVVDTDNDGADADDEVLTERWTDGAGRVLKSRTEHPGSAGGWSAVKIEYDIVGRALRQTVPTEVDSGWNPYGDDAARGWIWNASEFDWKGRTTRAIPSDSTGTDGKDTLFSYDGCGCAGGVATTVLGPLVPRDDYPTTNARRKIKSYEDILGRRVKTETFAWDGTTVYSTVVNSFNGRDQVTQSRRYDGGTSATTFQDNTATFDGFGRLATSHRPEQMDAGDNPLSTAYSYNPDGSISTIVDARGAITSNTYNVSGLLVQRTSTMPTPSPTATPSPSPTPNLNTSVAYEYDNLGNRTKMADAMGTVDYVYDELSRMTSETRAFNDTMANAPLSGNKFKLEYAYTLNGQLRWYKDPFGQEITHEFDRTGRLTDVTGSSFGGVTSYADDAEYRAWGGLKAVDYASGPHLAVTYNNRLQMSNYNLDNWNQIAVIDKGYSYYPDGKLSYMQDLTNSRFDRLNRYNSVGNVSQGKSGPEARGDTVAAEDMKFELPYRQSYVFDAFSNLTESNNLHWGESSWAGQSFNQGFDFDNNRVDEAGWVYDEDGRSTQSPAGAVGTSLKTFDAAGRVAVMSTGYSESMSFRDGDGQEVKRQTTAFDDEDGWVPQPTKYYVRSSALGGRVVSETWANGKKHRSYVTGIGSQTAVQSAYPAENDSLNELVLFEFADASGMTRRTTNKLGEPAATGDGGEGSPIELDPLGGSVGTFTPFFTIYVEYNPEYPELQPVHNYDYPTQDFSSLYAVFGNRIIDLPGFGTNWGNFTQLDMMQYEDMVGNARAGLGFVSNEQAARNAARAAALEQELRHTGLGGGAAGGDDGTRTSGGDETGGNGQWVDQTTHDVDIITATVTVRGGGYWNFDDDSRYNLMFAGVLPQKVTGLVISAVKEHLTQNEECKSFINSLLSQLATDTQRPLSGTIDDYLDEFSRTGTIDASIAMPKAPGAYHNGYGETRAPAWGKQGYGILVQMTPFWGTDKNNLTNAANTVLVLHELIHIINFRGKNINSRGEDDRGGFTDVAAARALETLGYAMSLEDYQATYAPDMNLDRAAGQLWGNILAHKCGASLNGAPRGFVK